LQPALEELQFSLDEDEEIHQYNRQAQEKITKKRTDLLKSQKNRIDLNDIRRFTELQRKLKEFLSDESAVRYEQNDITSIEQEIPAFALPVNAVKLTESDFLRGEKQA